ncbi:MULTISPECIES: IS3 family transposase [Flavobacterium]|uniref:IS3 family transposase n=1 Tax=Flavobacterium TaxID=237 RepID=UPI0021141734|nr:MULTISPECIES: IS3 family transposase [Flavobacterium]UUF13087.1 IS3 family transposase [Flavobacterium panici]
MAGKYKKYDHLFKKNAVLLSYEKDSLKEFSEEIGILPCLLTRWRKEYQEFGAGSFQGSGYARVHPKNKLFFELKKKSKESELRFEILKNASLYLYKGNIVIYQFIKQNEHKYSILKMCEILEVGYGRYNRWKNNGISQKQQQLALLKKELTSIFYSFKKQQGKVPITKELNSRGYKICEGHVSFYMKQLGLRRIAKKKFKVTTNSNHSHYIAPNVLNQKFKTDGPSKVWVSDITYIQTKRGFSYLTIIMDLYDRKIIGWNLSSRLSTQKTTLPAWEMAVINRKVSNGLIFHSDRGVQYANKVFSNRLSSFNCIRSMSRKGNHLDNAISEAFFSSFKRELLNRKDQLLSTKQMKAEVFEFIEEWYNKERIHTALNYKTIEQFNNINN